MRLIVLICVGLFSAYASAGVYKCTDSDGKIVYRASPCVEGQNNVEINIKTGTSTNLSEQEHQAVLSQAEQQQKIELEKQAQEQLLMKQKKVKQDAIDESAKNQFLIKNNPTLFSAFAIPPYHPDKLPALIQKFESRLPDIERLRRQAAEKALSSGHCGRVEASELDNKSSKDALQFKVDCSSAKTFYFNEQDLTR